MDARIIDEVTRNKLREMTRLKTTLYVTSGLNLSRRSLSPSLGPKVFPNQVRRIHVQKRQTRRLHKTPFRFSVLNDRLRKTKVEMGLTAQHWIPKTYNFLARGQLDLVNISMTTQCRNAYKMSSNTTKSNWRPSTTRDGKPSN